MKTHDDAVVQREFVDQILKQGSSGLLARSRTAMRQS